MVRYRLDIEYDGTGFCGWQAQQTQCGVQDRLQTAIAAFCQEDVTLFAAGRTDAGVHARAQTAHGDFSKSQNVRALRDGVNFHLGDAPAKILRARKVPDTFHARFSATARQYCYHIIVRSVGLVLERARAWRVPKGLDVAAMQAGAACLVGRHDFTTFRAASCQARSPVKTLTQLDVTADGDTIRITAQARSFLQHQMRSMVGALKYVGEGKWTPAQLKAALAACARERCPPLAPPYGLYLMGVDYANEK